MSFSRKFLAYKVSDFMKENGMNEADLAEKVGTNQSSVNRWFTKGSIPRPKVIKKLASLMELTPSDIVVSYDPEANEDADILERLADRWLDNEEDRMTLKLSMALLRPDGYIDQKEELKCILKMYVSALGKAPDGLSGKFIHGSPVPPTRAETETRVGFGVSKAAEKKKKSA